MGFMGPLWPWKPCAVVVAVRVCLSSHRVYPGMAVWGLLPEVPAPSISPSPSRGRSTAWDAACKCGIHGRPSLLSGLSVRSRALPACLVYLEKSGSGCSLFPAKCELRPSHGTVIHFSTTRLSVSHRLQAPSLPAALSGRSWGRAGTCRGQRHKVSSLLGIGLIQPVCFPSGNLDASFLTASQPQSQAPHPCSPRSSESRSPGVRPSWEQCNKAELAPAARGLSTASSFSKMIFSLVLVTSIFK